MGSETESEVDQRRERSPSFPYLELPTSLGLARRLFEAAKQSEARLVDAAKLWETTTTSGSLARYVAALSAYGLIEVSGSGLARKLRISDATRRILQDSRPGVKEVLLSEAALRPKIMLEIFDLWGFDRPDDAIAKSLLQFDYGFTSDAARRFLVVYDANLELIIRPQSTSETEAGISENSEASPAVVVAPKQPNRQQEHEDAREVRRDVFTLSEGNVVLEMPDIISESSFEDFADWLDLIKRRVQRTVRKAETP